MRGILLGIPPGISLRISQLCHWCGFCTSVTSDGDSPEDFPWNTLLVLFWWGLSMGFPIASMMGMSWAVQLGRAWVTWPWLILTPFPFPWLVLTLNWACTPFWLDSPVYKLFLYLWSSSKLNFLLCNLVCVDSLPCVNRVSFRNSKDDMCRCLAKDFPHLKPL